MNKCTLNPLFCSHMVLQANKPVRFFGEGEGEITVSLCSKTAKATCNNGKWIAELEPLEYGGPYTVEIGLNGEKISLSDVYLGDVYIVAGQSNHQFKLFESTTPKGKNIDRMRLFSSPRLEAGEPFSPADGWVVCSEENSPNWPALAYLVGEKIEADRDRAVGIITSYQGASVIETWVPEGLFESRGIVLADNQKTNSHFCEEYSAWNKDGTLYHYVVEKLIPYSVSAVIWYQGESDSSVGEAEVYDKELAALIECWRDAYKDKDLPFVVIQLAGLLDPATGDVYEGWKVMHKSQLNVPNLCSNTEVVKCADICENDDIHPKTKAPLALRIANVLEKNNW